MTRWLEQAEVGRIPSIGGGPQLQRCQGGNTARRLASSRRDVELRGVQRLRVGTVLEGSARETKSRHGTRGVGCWVWDVVVETVRIKKTILMVVESWPNDDGGIKSSEESKVVLHGKEEIAMWQQGLGATRSGDRRLSKSGGRWWWWWCCNQRGWQPDLVVVGPGV